MKGQMIFEFVVAAMLFFAIIFYVMGFLGSSVDAFSSGHHENFMQNKAIQISELLVRNPGVWSSGVPTTVGLAKDWPVISANKTRWFDSYCDTDYEGLLDMLDVFEVIESNITRYYNLNVRVGGRQNMTCGPPVPDRGEVYRMQRFALAEDSSVLNLTVSVW
jgi:hypothetical protein